MPNIVFLNISHETKKYQNQESVQRATWCQSNEKIKFKWIYGNSKILFEDEIDKIYVPVVDIFDNILLKTIYAIDFVSKKYDPDFIVRCNTNTYVDTNLLLEEIKNIDCQDYLYGHKSNHNDLATNKSIEFISGAMMVMPRKTYNKIKVKLASSNYGPDDVSLSFALANTGTKLINCSRCDISHGDDFYPRSHYRIKHSRVSNFTISRMKNVHQIYMKEKDIYKISTRNFMKFQIFEFIFILFEKKSDVQKEIILVVIVKRILDRYKKILNHLISIFN
jgi:hypothetical protein